MSDVKEPPVRIRVQPEDPKAHQALFEKMRAALQPKPLPNIELGSCCWFCLKGQNEVRKLIQSDATKARICDECIGLCNEILGSG